MAGVKLKEVIINDICVMFFWRENSVLVNNYCNIS